MPILPRAPQQDYYRRPGSSSSQESSVRRIPSRNQLQPSLSSPKGSVSDAGVNIIVEAPVCALLCYVHVVLILRITALVSTRVKSFRLLPG